VKNDAPIDEKKQERELEKTRQVFQGRAKHWIASRVSPTLPVGVEINVRNESTKGSHFERKK
jgi:hypothetical protein